MEHPSAAYPSPPPPSALQRLHSSLLSLFPSPNPKTLTLRPNHNLCPHDPSSTSTVLVPFPFRSPRSAPRGPPSPVASALGGLSTSVRIDGIAGGVAGDRGNGGGPAFIGQVFSMCDTSGTGLMAVTSRFDVPFLSKRLPDWVKSMFKFNKHENSGPVFRFFMDLNDAVAYVRRLNIPSGMVGACRLDVAYGHFKEKPHLFQFVPNAKQVKAANKLLKANRHRSGRKKLDGVPVFGAHNLNIAIATNDGIKWYTPYFFDKNLLDNILETSVDQHFHSLIQTRHGQRRRDVIDDSLAADVVEESGDSIFEPPEVQEVLDEMGHPGIPLSVVSKVAEIQLLDVVDRVMLGNRWLRKATGIQPKIPYLIDSFEARSAASVLKAKASTSSSDTDNVNDTPEHQRSFNEMARDEQRQGNHALSKGSEGVKVPFWKWLPNPWLKPPALPVSDGKSEPSKGYQAVDGNGVCQECANPLLPKITMVGISTGEGGKVTKASLKKTMENLTRALEQNNQQAPQSEADKDPLFVANVGDYSTVTRMNSV